MADRPEATRGIQAQEYRQSVVDSRGVVVTPKVDTVPSIPTINNSVSPVDVSASSSPLSQSRVKPPLSPSSSPSLYLRPGESPPGEAFAAGTTPDLTWRKLINGKWVALPGGPDQRYVPAPVDYNPFQFSYDSLPKLSEGFYWKRTRSGDDYSFGPSRIPPSADEKFSIGEVQAAIDLDKGVRVERRVGPRANPNLLRAFGFSEEQVRQNQNLPPQIGETGGGVWSHGDYNANEAQIASVAATKAEIAGGSQMEIDRAVAQAVSEHRASVAESAKPQLATQRIEGYITVTPDIAKDYPGIAIGTRLATTDKGLVLATGDDIKTGDTVISAEAHKADLTDALKQGRITQASYEAQLAKYNQNKTAYDKWASQFTPQELSEIQSGKYIAYDPNTKSFVATTKALMESRELAGYTPQELDEVYSGKYTVKVGNRDVPVTKAYYDDYSARQAVLSELKSAGFEEPSTMRSEYPKGGAPFESYETAPPAYDLVGAVKSGFDRQKLVKAFGEDAIKQTEAVVADISLLEKYGTLDAMEKSAIPSVGEAAARLRKSSDALPRDLTPPVVYPVHGTEKRWANVRTGERYTDSERSEAIKSRPAAQDEIVRVVDAKQMLSSGLSNVEQWRDYALERTKEEKEQGGKRKDRFWTVTDSILSGTRRAIIDVVTGTILTGGRFLLDPSGAAVGVVQGVTELGGKIARGIGGEYQKQVVAGDMDDIIYDTAMAYMTAKGAKDVAGAGIRTTQFAATVARGDYVPLRSMSMEKSTARVPFTDKQIARMAAAGVSEADIIAAGTDLTTQLAYGAKKATVTLGGVTTTIKNVPYQRSTGGGALFQATPDITQVDRGGSVPVVREWYAAGKVAIEPLERSYLTGQKAVKPGIVELRISPELIKEIGPQRRLIGGGKTLEPEFVLPSLDELSGMGYRLEPMPGKAGRGMSFDATLGPIQIRRFNLVRVTDNPTGLKVVKTGKVGDTGTVAIGDLHGTTKFANVFSDINDAFGKQVITGDPNQPKSWKWGGSKETVVVMGDIIDRGPAYSTLRGTFNRLADEAKATGGRVERLLGNHELAYLSDDAIKGIKYTDELRKTIKAELKEDIASGKVKAVVESDGKLFSHAGISLGTIKGIKGKSASFVADRLNNKLVNASKRGSFNDAMFARGRVEKDPASPLRNNRKQGGVFWLRPQEAPPAQLDLGFTQIVGHNPGFGVRRIWGDNFIETDVSRRTGGAGVYADTPFTKTEPVAIGTAKIPGAEPKIGGVRLANLKLQAMRDTVADVALGWDGRIQAIERIRNSGKAVREAVKSLDEQIVARKEAGDSVGVKYLQRQKSELLSPSGSDYLYGGIAFWRDIIMGRQNSVKILEGVNRASKPSLAPAISTIDNVRNRITEMSDGDIRTLFNTDKATIASRLDTSSLKDAGSDELRAGVVDRLNNLQDIVDTGVERNIVPHLDDNAIVSRYSDTIDEYTRSPERYINGVRRYGNTYGRESYGIRATEEPERTTSQIRSVGRIADDVRVEESARVSRPAETAIARTPSVSRVPELARTTTATTARVPDTARSPAPPDVARLPSVTPPPSIPPPLTPMPPPPPPPVSGLSRLSGDDATPQRIPDGSITWYGGELLRGEGKGRVLRPVWKYIDPEGFASGAKPRTLFAPPIGAINTDARTARDTVQIIGEPNARVPNEVNIDLGQVDIKVIKGREIRFTGGGKKTNVGDRVGSNTIGMGIDNESNNVVVLDNGLLPGSPVVSKSGVSRPAMAKRKPKRKGERLTEYERMTTLKGFRP